jgi:hypothetical protein
MYIQIPRCRKLENFQKFSLSYGKKQSQSKVFREDKKFICVEEKEYLYLK